MSERALPSKGTHVVMDIGDGRSIEMDFDSEVALAMERLADAVKTGRPPTSDELADMMLVQKWEEAQDAKYGGVTTTDVPTEEL